MNTVIPMIHVPDVSATVEWYRSIGFNVRNTNVEEGEMNWAALTYGLQPLLADIRRTSLRPQPG